MRNSIETGQEPIALNGSPDDPKFWSDWYNTNFIFKPVEQCLNAGCVVTSALAIKWDKHQDDYYIEK